MMTPRSSHGREIPSYDWLLDRLQSIDVNTAAGAAIEDVVAATEGRLTDEAADAVARFLTSSEIDNREAALWALVHYAHRADLEVEALALIISGILADDSDAFFGGSSAIGLMAQAGGAGAARARQVLKTDGKVRELLQWTKDIPDSS